MTIFRKLLIILSIYFAINLNAQVANYGFSQSATAYTSVTGNVVGTTASDEQRFTDPTITAGSTTILSGVGLPIGFNFTYDGIVYDRFGICTNGWISLGQSALGAQAVNMQSASTSNPISSTSTVSANMQAKIAALGRDLQGQTGSSITYTTLGATPNKTLVVQWNKYRRFSGTGENFSFQIKLKETSDVIDIAYGTFTTSNTSANVAQVGLRGFSNTDYNNRLIVNNTNNWATSTTGTANNSSVSFLNTLVPTSGQVFKWTPSVACLGTPNAGTAAATKTSICTTSTIGLSLLGATTGQSGLMYQWFSSVDNVIWDTLINETNNTSIQTLSTTNYFKCVLTCGVTTATSTPIQITLNSYTSTVPYFEGFENILSANEMPNCSWQITNSIKCNTNINAASNNRVAKTGSKFASFAWNTTLGGDYFFTNGIQLNAGINYYASADYVTDGALGWSEFSLLYGQTQSAATMTTIASATGTLTNTIYNNLAGTFSVTTSGLYHIGVKAIGDTVPFYLSFDDLSIVVLPNCTTPPSVGTIAGQATINTGSSNTYSVSTAVGNLQWYKGLTLTGPWVAIPTATNTSVTISQSTAGSFYLSAIASTIGCVSDTVNNPFLINVIVVANNVCSALPLSVGTTSVSYSVYGANNQAGEVVPPTTGASTNTGWENSVLDNTLWFSIIAPSSGNISIQSPGFDSQLALWQTNTCSGLLSNTTATLLAANDDDQNYIAHNGTQYSSYLQATCLTPGVTYYIQLDSFDPATTSDTTRIKIVDLGLVDKSFTGLNTTYCFANSATTFTPVTAGGIFTINTNTTSVSAFTPSLAGVGTHTITYNLFGCSTTSITTVKATPTLLINGTAAPICKGATATYTASGATTYAWLPAGGSATIAVVAPTTSTNYTVTGTTNGCSAKAFVSATVIASPTVTVNSATICNGNSVNLIANGATTYSWNTSATTSSINVSPTALTKYTVTGTSLGCSTTKTTSVVVYTVPVITAGANKTITCASSTVLINGSGSAASYTWVGSGIITGLNTTTATIGSAGIYTLTGSSNGCLSNSITVTVSNSVGVPTLAVSPTSNICLGNSTNLLVNTTTGNSIMWSTGETTASISVTPTTTTNYSVVVTNTLSNCIATGNVLVTVNTVPTASANVTQTITCATPTITLTGAGVTTYSWSGAGIVSGINTSNALVNTAGTYSLIGQTNGCVSNMATVTVTSNTVLPVLTVTSNTAICTGKTITLLATSNPTTVTYAWAPISSTSKSITITPTITTNYFATVTNTTNGCAATNSITVTVNNTPTLTVNSATICNGSVATLTVNGANTYTWMPGFVNGTTYTTSPNITFDYTVTGKSAQGCTNVATTSIYVNNAPIVTVNNATTCAGIPVTLTANGANTYSWSNNVTTQSITVTPTTQTTYTVTGYIGSCFDEQTVTITTNATPTITSSTFTSPLCNGLCDGGLSVTATGGTGNYFYNTSFGSTVMPATNLCAGIYTVNVTDDNNCGSSVAVITINEPSKLTTTFSFTSASCGSCADGAADALITGGITPYIFYEWINGITTPFNNNILPGCYSFTVTDSNGCQDTSSVCISFGTNLKLVSNQNRINVFPNPLSNKLVVEIYDLKPNTVFEIYDALGKLVFTKIIETETTPINTTNLFEGVYLYKILNKNGLLKTGKLIKN